MKYKATVKFILLAIAFCLIMMFSKGTGKVTIDDLTPKEEKRNSVSVTDMEKALDGCSVIKDAYVMSTKDSKEYVGVYDGMVIALNINDYEGNNYIEYWFKAEDVEKRLEDLQGLVDTDIQYVISKGKFILRLDTTLEESTVNQIQEKFMEVLE